ncbi:prepilin-type N-terminal cleavage/methylation domain-containing protein [bacterium]|nr:prepilin-type N-terminal cleavage/methylation domain-containing protein [bacterium]
MRGDVDDVFAKRQQRAFTLIELLVTIAIMSVLAAILLAGVTQARAFGLRTACTSNLRQLGFAFQMYAQDFEGFLPHEDDSYGVDSRWFEALTPYLGGDGTDHRLEIKQCPAYKPPPDKASKKYYTYKFNSRLEGYQGSPDFRKSDSIPNPSETVLLYDGVAFAGGAIASTINGKWGSIDDYHSGGTNFLLVDGHVQWHKEELKDGYDYGWPDDSPGPFIWDP